MGDFWTRAGNSKLTFNCKGPNLIPVFNDMKQKCAHFVVCNHRHIQPVCKDGNNRTRTLLFIGQAHNSAILLLKLL